MAALGIIADTSQALGFLADLDAFESELLDELGNIAEASFAESMGSWRTNFPIGVKRTKHTVRIQISNIPKGFKLPAQVITKKGSGGFRLVGDTEWTTPESARPRRNVPLYQGGDSEVDRKVYAAGNRFYGFAGRVVGGTGGQAFAADAEADILENLDGAADEAARVFGA